MMKKARRTLKVTANIKENRLLFTVAGEISKRDIDALYTDVRFAVADLKEGFIVVTDLQNCRFAHPSGLASFQKIMNYLINNGLSNVVRILHDEGLAQLQINNLAARMQGYKPVYVSSMEEAEAMIPVLSERKGLRFIIHNQQVVYILQGKEQYGQVDDISTCGCLVASPTKLPVLGDNLQLRVQFGKKKEEAVTFELDALVVRVDVDRFAVAYKDLDVETQTGLWEILVREASREIDVT